MLISHLQYSRKEVPIPLLTPTNQKKKKKKERKLGQIDGKQWKQWLTLFFWAPKSLQMVTAAMKLKDAYSLEGKL